METNDELVEYLIRTGYLKSENIIEAFKKIDRKDFILPEYQSMAYKDKPIRTFSNQTTSAPSIIAIMLEMLKPFEGAMVYEIGTGSGYMTALLAEIVKDGIVVSIELFDKLANFAKENIEKYGFRNVVLLHGDGKKDLLNARLIYGSYELLERALEKRFDRIVFGAAIKEVPSIWIQYSKRGTCIVGPFQLSYDQYLFKLVIDSVFGPVIFVPFL